MVDKIAAAQSDRQGTKHVVVTLSQMPQIILVEDNITNQRLGLVQLKWLGYSAQAVNSGYLAIQAISEKQYDLVLMDCNMPEMDGYEATRRIREAEIATGHHIPIVALTASAQDKDRLACIAAGMDDYMSKPIDIDLLGTIIARWIGTGIDKVDASGLQPIQESTNQQAFPTLDHKAFDKVRELMLGAGPNVFVESIDEFITYSATMLVKLRKAVLNVDEHEVNQIAHTLKSSTASYGANYLSFLCRDLEARARAGSVDSFGDYLIRIESEFQNVRTALLIERDRE